MPAREVKLPDYEDPLREILRKKEAAKGEAWTYLNLGALHEETSLSCSVSHAAAHP